VLLCELLKLSLQLVEVGRAFDATEVASKGKVGLIVDLGTKNVDRSFYEERRVSGVHRPKEQLGVEKARHERHGDAYPQGEAAKLLDGQRLVCLALAVFSPLASRLQVAPKSTQSPQGQPRAKDNEKNQGGKRQECELVRRVSRHSAIEAVYVAMEEE
jgi:hypothetical protein